MRLGDLVEAITEVKVENVQANNGMVVPAITLGPQVLGENEVKQLLFGIGVKRYVEHPAEVIKRVTSFARAIKKSALYSKEEGGVIKPFSDLDFQFENIACQTYGKSFDRIVLESRERAITIIHGMEHAGGAYVLYINHMATAAWKGRTMQSALNEVYVRFK